MRLMAVYAPDSSVVRRTRVFVPSLVTATSTPDMAAPVVSVTLPMMEARSTCATARLTVTKTSNKATMPNLGICASFGDSKMCCLQRSQRSVLVKCGREWAGTLERVTLQIRFANVDPKARTRRERVPAVFHPHSREAHQVFPDLSFLPRVHESADFLCEEVR